MLLALRIKNFKSIREAEVRFGPFTCFIGHNGSGKSNLFDAIHLLRELASRDIHTAASRIRSASGDASPLDLVFRRDATRQIELSADMIVPASSEDDFGQLAEATKTLLTYELRLQYSPKFDLLSVAHERLRAPLLEDTEAFIGFDWHDDFKESVVKRSSRTYDYISTHEGTVKLHQDGRGIERTRPICRTPLTVIGGTSTSDYPTVLGAKREMSSWKVVQLEPSMMRSPDRKTSRMCHVSASGAGLSATLERLLMSNSDVKYELLSRLHELVDNIQDIDVYLNEATNQLSLRAKVPGVDRWLFARSLSDGTLRYIAMLLMLLDVQDRSVLCLEEPENGIHPARIHSIVRLLRDFAVDPQFAVDDDNPLRQAIVNTHSPDVARQVPFDEVVFVQIAKSKSQGPTTVFRPIERTWRTKDRESGLSALPMHRQAYGDFLGGAELIAELRPGDAGNLISVEAGSAY